MAATEDVPQSLIPGLEEEAALLCLARVPRAYHKVCSLRSSSATGLLVAPASWPLE